MGLHFVGNPSLLAGRGAHPWLWVVTSGYEVVMGGNSSLQVVMDGYGWLRLVSGGYAMVTGVFWW